MERTDKNATTRQNHCYLAEAVRAHPLADQEIIEIMRKAYCQQDQAFTHGFNPKLTLLNPRNGMDDAEGICEFKVVMED